MSHAIVIGGTGMLVDAAIELSGRYDELTMVARSQASLERFAGSVNPTSKLRCVTSDWGDKEAFLGALSQLSDHHGPPDLVLAWLHDSELGPDCARALCRANHYTVFVQVCGSMTPRLGRWAEPSRQALHDSVTYRRVILGYTASGGARRWLTDAEICAGALRAIDEPRALTIVGELDD